MTNYPIILTTKEEAEAWFEKHPDGVVVDATGDEIKIKEIPFTNHEPFTVEKTGNTITINGTVFKEGDDCRRTPTCLKGCIVEVIESPSGDYYDLKILHIPDEVADKPEPKEPKTLTLEELTNQSIIWLINPLTKVIHKYLGCYPTFETFYALKAHVADGHKLYATPEDAELGKELGMS